MSCNSPIFSHLRDDVAAPRLAVESDLCVSMFLYAELKHLEYLEVHSFSRNDLQEKRITKLSFSESVNSRGCPIFWFPRLPEFISLDFFLWGFVNWKEFQSYLPRNANELDSKAAEVTMDSTPGINVWEGNELNTD